MKNEVSQCKIVAITHYVIVSGQSFVHKRPEELTESEFGIMKIISVQTASTLKKRTTGFRN